MTSNRRIEVEIRVEHLSLAAILEFDGQDNCVRWSFVVYIDLFCKKIFATLEDAMAYLAYLVKREFDEFVQRQIDVLVRAGQLENYDHLDHAKKHVQEVLAPFAKSNPSFLVESEKYFSEFYEAEKLPIWEPPRSIPSPGSFNH